MITRTIIKLFSHEFGFTLFGLPKSKLEFEAFLKSQSPCPLFLSLSESSISLITTSAQSPFQNLIHCGLLLLHYLSFNYSISISTTQSSNSIQCICQNVPIGLGEPCFDKFQAVLCKENLLIPNAEGFEIGSGFGGTLLNGSEHNDPFGLVNDHISPISNHAGGVLGGITTGAEVYFEVHFSEVNEFTQKMVETCTAAVILDFILIQKTKT